MIRLEVHAEFSKESITARKIMLVIRTTVANLLLYGTAMYLTEEHGVNLVRKSPLSLFLVMFFISTFTNFFIACWRSVIMENVHTTDHVDSQKELSGWNMAISSIITVVVWIMYVSTRVSMESMNNESLWFFIRPMLWRWLALNFIATFLVNELSKATSRAVVTLDGLFMNSRDESVETEEVIETEDIETEDIETEEEQQGYIDLTEEIDIDVS